jgi:pilus assembly protein Flp/PilA
MRPSTLLTTPRHADPLSMMMLIALFRDLQERLQYEAGQTMAEYGILIAVIALIVVLAATLLGGQISSLFASTGSNL